MKWSLCLREAAAATRWPLACVPFHFIISFNFPLYLSRLPSCVKVQDSHGRRIRKYSRALGRLKSNFPAHTVL